MSDKYRVLWVVEELHEGQWYPEHAGQVREDARYLQSRMNAKGKTRIVKYAPIPKA